jgi:trypsin
MRSTANAHFCGGFIINERWVGCAAHCTINRTPANTLVVVGAQNRINGGITHTTSRIINHPNYSGATLINDVSVIQVTNPISETGSVRRIPLGSVFITGGNAIASGWGQTSNPGSAATELQWLQVQVITNEACRSRLSTTQAARIFDSTICTSGPVGQGLCMGDSGGPLTQGGAVIGAVSWGIHKYIIYYIIY